MHPLSCRSDLVLSHVERRGVYVRKGSPRRWDAFDILDGARSSIRGCGRDPASSVDGGIDDWSNFCSSRSLCLHRPPHTAFPLFSSSRCYARHTLPAYTITSTQTEATIDPSNKYRELGYGAVAEVTANWGYFTWTTTLSCQYILPPRVSMLPKTWTIVVDDNGVTTATW